MDFDKLKADFEFRLGRYDAGNCDWKYLPEYLIQAVKEEYLSIPIEPPVKPANSGVDMDNCFYCGQRASELTQIRVAIKPPNTPNRWKVIGVACNTCNDKFISQIDPSRLSV